MCGVVRWGVMWGRVRRVGGIGIQVEKLEGVWVRASLRLESKKMAM